MKTIGITGGIGSGKSTVAKVFVSMGYPVYNSDVMAKHILNSDPELIEQIKINFGQDSYVDQVLDRKKLAKAVFNNPKQLALLNKLVHPAVGRNFEAWKEDQHTNLIFKEAAILFETGIYKSLDATVLVTSPKQIRIDRVMMRDKVSEAQVKARMDNQWSDQEKEKLSDYTIDNSGNILVIPQVKAILSELEK